MFSSEEAFQVYPIMGNSMIFYLFHTPTIRHPLAGEAGGCLLENLCLEMTFKQ